MEALASYENLMPAGDDNIVGGMTSGVDKLFTKMDKGQKQMLKVFKEVEKVTEKIKKNMEAANGGKSSSGMSSSLGAMPTFGASRAATIAGRVGLGTAAVGAIGMGMMPNTSAAVTQRLGADAVAGISGLNSRQVILRSNNAVGGGATSAMGPTMAAMSLMYSGGYTANSGTFRNVMPQVGGLSALTGGTNEQMAQGLAGINAMRFLRIGVQARDTKGNLRPPNAIINDTYRFLYGGRKVTPEQAALVLNPGSKGYATIQAIAGGDQNLAGIIQMGIIARAKKDSPLKKEDLKGSNRALDLLGVGQESPMRTNFRYNTSEARKLQATEKGLVGGYNVAMRTTAAVNDGFSKLAEEAAGVANALGTLRGVLQTLPAAGNTGATLTGVAGTAASVGMNMYMLSKMRGLYAAGTAGAAAATGGVTAGGAAAAAGATGAAGYLAKAKGLFKGGFKSPFVKGLGRAGLALGVYQGMEFLQKRMQVGPGWLRAGGNFMFDLGQGALTGLAAGGIPGAVAGTVAGGVGSIANPYGQGGDCTHGNVGPHKCGVGGDNSTSMQNMPAGSMSAPQKGFTTGKGPGNQDTKGQIFGMPVPAGTRVTSHYGPRDNSKNPQISAYHRGIDYGVQVGTPIVAAANGTVTHAGTHRQYGYYIILNHGKKSTLYGHLSQILVKVGQQVNKGDVIAKSGGKRGAPGAGTSTGPHLHFELRDPGGVGAQGRVNPKSFFGKLVSSVKSAVSNIFGAVKGFLGIGKEKEDIKSKTIRNSGEGLRFEGTLSNLSSVPLSESLSSSMMSGAPVNFADFQREFPADDIEQGIRFGKSGGKHFLNNTIDKVSGDSGSMVGGSRKGLIQFLHNIGFRGKALDTAFAVALAESGGNSGTINKRSKDYGLFQINMDGKNYDDRIKKEWNYHGTKFKLKGLGDLLNPTTNAKVAYHMTNKGRNWIRWVSHNTGDYTKFLDDAVMAREQAGIGGDNPATAGMAMETTGAAGYRRSGSISGSVTSNQTINVKVDLQLKVDKLGSAEITRVASSLKKAINDEFKVNGLGVN